MARWWGWYFVACLSGTLVPLLVLVLGSIALLLEQGGLSGHSVRLGRHLVVPLPEAFIRLDSIEQLACLVGLAFSIAVLHAAMLYLFLRGAYGRARQLVRSLHEQVLATSIQVAAGDGITAQRRRTAELIEDQIPRIHRGLIARWRALPRSLVMLAICTLIAVAVDTWLTLLAIISGAMVWRLYQFLQRQGDAKVATYDVPQMQRRLIESVQTAPLISRVRGDETAVDESGGPLGQLIEFNLRRDSFRAFIVPAVSIATAASVALLLIALGGNMLSKETHLSLPAAFVLTMSLIGAVTSATRILGTWGMQADFREASDAVCSFVDRAAAARPTERLALGGAKHVIKLSDVSMLDGAGRSLLDRLSLQLEPASMVAILGTDSTSVSALVELLLGFGTPRSGTVSVDDVLIDQLHERWLSKNVLWIGKGGPIWSGSVLENLAFTGVVPDSGQISDATRKVGVFERLQSLPDGFSTLLSTDDHRLDEMSRYGIAIARAWLRRPAVIIVQEPSIPSGTLSDDPGMDALAELAQLGSLVIVLPQRLRTLRLANRVLLMNGGQLAGEGRHEELLGSSDLYRHLNYLLFNPFRNRPVHPG